MKRALLRTSAFTLLEIMLVVTIIAILVGGAIVAFAPALDTTKKTKAAADIEQMKTWLVMYSARAGGFPTTEQGLQALAAKPTSEPVPSNWSPQTDDIPKDPWNHDYLYECPGTHHPDSFDLFSCGPDGKPHTPDDIGNWK